MKLKITYLRKQLYLIIPIICLFLWALISQIKDNFIIVAADYPAFYDSGKYIFIHPENVYSNLITPRYRYLPSFATIFSIMTIFPYDISAWIWFCLLFIIGSLSLLIFNKILILKGIDNKIVRLLFLLLISNGLKIMQTFDILQTKIVGLFFILLFLMREIKYRKLEEYDFNSFKFNFIQLSLLIFVIGMMPFFIFLVAIYLLYNVNYRNIFSKTQIKKYLILILVFLYQNFMFFIAPVLMTGFFSGTSNAFRTNYTIYTPMEIVNNQIIYPVDSLSCFIYALGITYVNTSLTLTIFASLIILLTIILLIKKNMTLERKIGYFTLFSLFFNVYPRPNTMVVFMPLIALAFVRKIDIKGKILEFVKTNFVFLISLISLSLLYLMPPIHYIYDAFPFLMNIPYSLSILLMRWTVLYIILAISLLCLDKKERNAIEI
jgi:hypothetical protein